MDFLKIAGKDIKSIFKNRFIRVSVIAIIVVPLLYSVLYLNAFWDPYSKLADMPVAVVNLDEGTEFDGKIVKYGEGIIDNLKGNDSVGWKFVSQEEADRGLKGDKYYAKFEISKDFSEKVISAKSGIPTQAGLKFVCNEKKNFLASQVNSKVESALKAQIVETISDNYVTASFDNLYTVKDGMSAAADGSLKINNGLHALNDNLPELEDGVNKLNDGSTRLNNGLGELKTQSSVLRGGIKQLYDGSGVLVRGLKNLNDAYTTQVHPAIAQLNGGAFQLKQGLDAEKTSVSILGGSVTPIKQVSDQISGVSDTVNAGYASLNAGINAILSTGSFDNTTKVTLINKALNDFNNNGLAPYTNGVKTYSVKVNQFTTGTESLVGSVNTVSGAVDQISGGLNQLQTKLDKYTDEANPGFAKGLENAYAGSQRLNGGLQDLNTKAPVLIGGIDKAYNGSTQLKDGISTLNGKVPELKNGVTQLYDGSTELSTKIKDGSTKLSSGLVNSPEDMGKFVSSPVELKIEPINSVPNYGTGFAPYFINLSLWIGAIMMFFVISTKTEDHSEATRFAKAFGKYLSFGFVGVLQAVLVGIAVLFLGLKPTNITLYFGMIIFFSLVYVSIVQCLISLFGDAGRLLSIVLLILQLTACAGTFPLELVPHLFVILNPFMPFTYSVEALREITSATVINYQVVFNDLIILGVMLIGFLTISIVFHRLGEKMQSAIEGRKEAAM